MKKENLENLLVKNKISFLLFFFFYQTSNSQDGKLFSRITKKILRGKGKKVNTKIGNEKIFRESFVVRMLRKNFHVHAKPFCFSS